MSDLPNPINRYEKYLNAIATGNSDDLPTPTTREEVFLDYIAKNGGGGGGGDVTGVKGDAESTYRKGNVNLTPENLGLGNVNNTSDAQKPVSTATQAALDLKANVADVNIFHGTAAAWDALPLSEKVKYTDAMIEGGSSDNPVGNLNSLTTTDKTSCVGAINEINDEITGIIYRTRNNITSRLSNLITAISEQDLGKYGYKIGDYFVGASGITYNLADMDTFYGRYTGAKAIMNTHHLGIVACPPSSFVSPNWQASGTPTGYEGSDLHAALKGTVLDSIKSDLIALFGGSTGLEHLLGHRKYYATLSGSAAWSQNDEYISALTEMQVFGSVIYSMDKYQQGEGCNQLDIFRRYNPCEIFGKAWVWFRSISSQTEACDISPDGNARSYAFTGTARAAGLILFY